jgi:dipeptidyl-peptidase III
MGIDTTQYGADHPPTVVPLAIAPHFNSLTPTQKRYAHHLSRASFLGTRITLRQVSPESVPIYELIVAVHKACDGDYDTLASDTGVSRDDVELWLEYAAQFLGNCGNYKGFGDVKFVPRISLDQLRLLTEKAGAGQCKELFHTAMGAGGGIYETREPKKMHLGYLEDGHMTTYYPDEEGVERPITKEEIELIGDACEKAKLLLENTRLRKLRSGDFEMLIASGISNPPSSERDLGDVDSIPLTGKLEGKKVTLVYGDHEEEMAKIATEIRLAEKYASNDTEKAMMHEYARSFSTGSIEAFKESQRYWIKDKGPVVETDLGFVETYRDPHGVRGEWEGFVAMVNQERTRAFGKLVKAAPGMIPKLPWSKDYEKDHFMAPDFTSLEVLSFAGSGIPAGINIPNYDDIRQTLGFKNVSLGNVLSATAPNEAIPFIRKQDDELYRKYRDPAFEVQVGIHELLGHGTGKLLQETSPGVYNFDVKNPPTSPVTGRPITTWYKPGQTWSSVFGSIASSYEECRAECVAMALACDFEILQIFGFGDGKEDINNEAGDVLYVSYLQMARAGVAAL